MAVSQLCRSTRLLVYSHDTFGLGERIARKLNCCGYIVQSPTLRGKEQVKHGPGIDSGRFRDARVAVVPWDRPAERVRGYVGHTLQLAGELLEVGRTAA